ncbi:MAG: hypothetical protein AAGB00_05295 [Planctomycetota bacterium]
MNCEETIHVAIERGKVSRFLEVPELAVRRLDAGDAHDDDGDPAASADFQLQGRIVNATKHKLSAVKYDVSYYDTGGRFLGLDKSGFLDDDELDAEDFLAIDLDLDLPPETARCVFNCRALKTGWVISRFFWG